MSKTSELSGPYSFQIAKQRARFGHRDWIAWRDKAGVSRAAVKSPETVKRCLLDVGTKGNWSLICSGGIPMKGFWWLGLNLLSQMRLGMY